MVPRQQPKRAQLCRGGDPAEANEDEPREAANANWKLGIDLSEYVAGPLPYAGVLQADGASPEIVGRVRSLVAPGHWEITQLLLAGPKKENALLDT